RALGSKSGAKALAQQQGVPCLPGYFGADQSDEKFTAEATRIGYPVMVKAVAGGGGRGMRLVTEPQQLNAALHSARSEAASSFGSNELLVEKALLAPRHVELQIFADSHGNCIHLGERDCSVQRRHQKIMEESPSPAVDEALRERMGSCAVQLAQAAGYVGAGTVEFLLEGNEFFLMEMNTRLQVEHPVTEAVTGLDLVEWQIHVARGLPLPLQQNEVVFGGHAIEVRLCAEDEHFTPHTGTVQRFVAPTGVRCDHALQDGLVVSPYYDAMLGKLIAHGANRQAAIAQLGLALDQTVLLGLPTNRAFLRACLQHPVFANGDAAIPFLAEHADAIRQTLQHDAQQALPAASIAVHFSASTGAAPALALPFARPLRMRHGDRIYPFTLRELGQGKLSLSYGDTEHAALCQRKAPGQFAVSVDGLRHAVRLVPANGRWHVQVNGTELWLHDATLQPPAGAGAGNAGNELRAPFNGKVIALHFHAGDVVRRGTPLLVVESMKLEHVLAAPRDGVLASVEVATGQQVTPGQVLLRFTP
ncbi:MAG: biotin/lipoyl-containing protein, partial [Pseudomonadota bacterium]